MAARKRHVMVPQRCRRTPTLLLFVSLAMAVAVSGVCADDDKMTAMRTKAPSPVSRRVPTASPAETVVTPSLKEKRNATPSPPHGAQDSWSYANVAAWPATCAGNQQSPMPLRHTPTDAHRPGSILTLLTAAKTSKWRAVPAEGGTIALLCVGYCGVVKVNGMNHMIKNMHWHTPSEHTVDGQRLAAELHMVAFAGGKIAVLSALFKVSKKNELVGRTIRAMSEMGSMSATQKDVKDKFFSGANVSAAVYKGSLTTPPCTEGLTWVVTTKVGKMSKKQLAEIRKLLGGHDNARPLQPPKGRSIDWVDAP